MQDDLDTLGARIDALKDKRQKRENGGRKSGGAGNNKAGVQAGMEFCFAIALSVLIGYKMDEWFGTAPLWLILWFFLGVATGFWSLYKFSLKFQTPKRDSQLHEAEKTANKAPEND